GGSLVVRRAPLGTPGAGLATAAVRARSPRPPRGRDRAAWGPDPTAARRTPVAGPPWCRRAWERRYGWPPPRLRTRSQGPPPARWLAAACAATAAPVRAAGPRAARAPRQSVRAPRARARAARAAPRSLRRRTSPAELS